MALHATISGGTATEGVYLADGGVLTPVALAGETAPDTGGGTYAHFRLTFVNASGDVAFDATVSGGTAAQGLFVDSGGTDASLLLEGEVAPGTGGQTYTGYKALGYSDAGEVVLSAGLSGGGEGVFLASTGADTLVALDGDPAPGTGGGTYNFDFFLANNTSVSSTGEVAFASGVSGGSVSAGVFRVANGRHFPVVLDGDPVDATWGGGTFGVAGNAMLTPVNAVKETVVDLPISGGSFTRGLFSDFGAGLRPVVFSGETSPGTGGGVFFGSLFASLGDGGVVAFHATLSGGSATVGVFRAVPPVRSTAEITLEVQAQTSPVLTPISSVTAAVEMGVSGTNLQSLVVGGGFAGTATSPSPTTQSVSVSLPGASVQRTGAGTSGVLAGSFPLRGQQTIDGSLIDFQVPGGTLGVGGSTISFFGISMLRSVGFSPWGTQTVTLLTGTSTSGMSATPYTAMGFAHGPASMTSTVGQASGVLQLVTPTQVGVIDSGGTFYAGHVSRLTIRFLPEPRGFVGPALGAAGVLVLVGLRSRRRS
jgi:hypothetical protein